MPETKPSDWFLGVSEFFAILLPGAALVYILQPLGRPFIPSNLLPVDKATGWAVFAVLSYTIGHVLHAISEKLDDPLYDELFLRHCQSRHYRATKLIGLDRPMSAEEKEEWASLSGSTLVARAFLRSRGTSSGTTLYDWCLSLVRLKNAPGAVEVD